MKTNEYPKWLGSSQDLEKLALTWKGVLVGLIPLILAILQILDINFTSEELNELLTVLSGAVSAVMIAIGLLRKLYFKFRK